MTLHEQDALREWNRREVLAWVEAAFERNFDLRTLENNDLRIACYNEFNAQLDRRALANPGGHTLPLMPRA